MKKLLLVLSVAVFSLTSCSKEEITDCNCKVIMWEENGGFDNMYDRFVDTLIWDAIGQCKDSELFKQSNIHGFHTSIECPDRYYKYILGRN
jgi:hypothetical protein